MTTFKKLLNELYGKYSQITAHQGKLHDYLEMMLDYWEKGKEKINMSDYIEEMIQSAPIKIKVNDKLGNPVLISVILVWRVQETYKAAFEVDNYEDFVKVQTDSAVRKLAGTYPYDHFEDEKAELTLSSNFEKVNGDLEKEISERLQMAGLEVIEARIAYLAYAPEIAQAMLRRQQAIAIVAARQKIVEGAVGMVESALQLLSEKEILKLDEEKKAAARIIVEKGAHFVKTSTGFSKQGAQVRDVTMLRSIVGPDFGIKASGGIRDYASAKIFLQAGANRIGTSAGVQIMRTPEPGHTDQK